MKVKVYYNPIGWDKPAKNIDHKNCSKNFIFSLKNGTIQNSILSHVITPINCYSNHGPRFGSGCDLAMLDNFKK